MTLIRYPGSKAKLVDRIVDWFPEQFVEPLFVSRNAHYIEPFFGSGAVGFHVMERMHCAASVTIADLDVGIVSLWKSVLSQPRSLIRKIINFVPTVEQFYRLKQSDGEFTDEVDTGFRKLALHRLSVSGFGVMAGGPIGGRKQLGAYTVGCRWKPQRMALCIARLHKLLKKFARLQILHSSVFDVLTGIQSANDETFVYLDPPYFEKGSQLYKFGFSPNDHTALARVLMGAAYGWTASYDDHPEIRKLYSGCNFQELEIIYSNAVCREAIRPKNREVLIIPATHA